MRNYSNLKVSPKEAFDLYLEKYPNTIVKEFELESKTNLYKIKGRNQDKEYKVYIDPETGVIAKVVEQLSKGLYTEINRENTDKIQDLVNKTFEDAGTNSQLVEWSLDIDDGMLELSVEVKLENNDKVKYKYNLASGQLLKRKWLRLISSQLVKLRIEFSKILALLSY